MEIPMEFELTDDILAKIESEHKLTRQEVDSVLESLDAQWTNSRISQRNSLHGWTNTGRYIFIPVEQADDETWRVISAYELEKTVLPLDEKTKRHQRWSRRRGRNEDA
jgi:hypothetical protein